MREAKRQWPGLPDWAFAHVGNVPFPNEIARLDAPIVALLARAFMLLKESYDAEEALYTGAEHIAHATARMSGLDRPDRGLDADLDRFRRKSGDAPSA